MYFGVNKVNITWECGHIVHHFPRKIRKKNATNTYCTTCHLDSLVSNRKEQHLICTNAASWSCFRFPWKKHTFGSPKFGDWNRQRKHIESTKKNEFHPSFLPKHVFFWELRSNIYTSCHMIHSWSKSKGVFCVSRIFVHLPTEKWAWQKTDISRKDPPKKKRQARLVSWMHFCIKKQLILWCTVYCWCTYVFLVM